MDIKLNINVSVSSRMSYILDAGRYLLLNQQMHFAYWYNADLSE